MECQIWKALVSDIEWPGVGGSGFLYTISRLLDFVCVWRGMIEGTRLTIKSSTTCGYDKTREQWADTHLPCEKQHPRSTCEKRISN
jgi:hypothetical protein